VSLDDDTASEQLVRQLAAALLDRSLMLASAESCTGGLIAGALTELAGSSAWFERGLVTYSNQAKMDLLGVPAAILERDGAVSEACAAAMAQGCARTSGADLALSVTGIAGPSGGTPEKPVGTVCFAWSSAIGPARVATRHFEGDRHAVRMQSVSYALLGMLAYISETKFASTASKRASESREG